MKGQKSSPRPSVGRSVVKDSSKQIQPVKTRGASVDTRLAAKKTQPESTPLTIFPSVLCNRPVPSPRSTYGSARDIFLPTPQEWMEYVARNPGDATNLPDILFQWFQHGFNLGLVSANGNGLGQLPTEYARSDTVSPSVAPSVRSGESHSVRSNSNVTRADAAGFRVHTLKEYKEMPVLKTLPKSLPISKDSEEYKAKHTAQARRDEYGAKIRSRKSTVDHHSVLSSITHALAPSEGGQGGGLHVDTPVMGVDSVEALTDNRVALECDVSPVLFIDRSNPTLPTTLYTDPALLMPVSSDGLTNTMIPHPPPMHERKLSDGRPTTRRTSVTNVSGVVTDETDSVNTNNTRSDSKRRSIGAAPTLDTIPDNISGIILPNEPEQYNRARRSSAESLLELLSTDGPVFVNNGDISTDAGESMGVDAEEFDAMRVTLQPTSVPTSTSTTVTVETTGVEKGSKSIGRRSKGVKQQRTTVATTTTTTATALLHKRHVGS